MLKNSSNQKNKIAISMLISIDGVVMY